MYLHNKAVIAVRKPAQFRKSQKRPQHKFKEVKL
jgi:hypothetical protein